MSYGINSVVMSGNLGADAESRFLADGTPVTNFTFAHNSGTKEKPNTFWLRGSVFGKYAEAIAPHLKKGKPVIVEGELEVRTFERKEGGTGTSVDIRVRKIQLVGDAGARNEYSDDNSAPTKRASYLDEDEEDPEDIPF